MKNNKALVYAITNLRNGKQYVGGTTNPSQRWSIHKSGLRKGDHYAKEMQIDWSLHGEHEFIFEEIEWCDVVDLDTREQYHLTDRQPAYNASHFVNVFADPDFQANLPRGLEVREYTAEHASKISASLTGKKLTDEHRKRISEVQMGKEITPEWRQHISESMKGNPNVSRPKSEEHKASVRKAMKEKWEDPEYRAMMSKKRSNRKPNVNPRSEEAKAKVSESRKEAWQKQKKLGYTGPERDELGQFTSQ